MADLTDSTKHFCIKIITAFVVLFVLCFSNVEGEGVDYSYCKQYNLTVPPHIGLLPPLPFWFMGETWDTQYFITTHSGDFSLAAYSICERYDMKIASIRTDCEYGILEKWFLSHFPTDYSLWIGGLRFGLYFHPIWVTTGEPIDLSEFGRDVDNIPGPYFPGGYNPISEPYANCIAVNRNCPVFTSAPTDPCEQTETYPDLQFMWEDCRQEFRVVCEKPIYTKEGEASK